MNLVDDDILKRFSNLSMNMEDYYYSDFLPFYINTLNQPPAQARRNARAAAQEQVVLDRLSMESRQQEQIAQRVKLWSDAYSKRLEEKYRLKELERLEQMLQDLNMN